jgi:hypothetical protein
MKAEETGGAALPLQRANVDVQLHPIDSLDLQGDVVGQGPQQRFEVRSFRLRYDFDPSGSTAAFGGLNPWRELLAVLHCRPEPLLGLCRMLGADRNTPRRSEAEPR